MALISSICDGTARLFLGRCRNGVKLLLFFEIRLIFLPSVDSMINVLNDDPQECGHPEQKENFQNRESHTLPPDMY
jgi:hypothetical protein